MTASHSFTIGKADSPLCRCGQANETVHHKVFECTFEPACPVALAPWKERTKAQTHALLCPQPCNKDDRDLWRKVRRRAISALSNLHPHEEEIDWRGHDVTIDVRGEYVYCVNCLQCRKAKDAKHLAAKACEELLWHVKLNKGAYTKSSNHVLRLVFRPWKISARRPALQCSVCVISGPGLPTLFAGLVLDRMVSCHVSLYYVQYHW